MAISDSTKLVVLGICLSLIFLEAFFFGFHRQYCTSSVFPLPNQSHYNLRADHVFPYRGMELDVAATLDANQSNKQPLLFNKTNVSSAPVAIIVPYRDRKIHLMIFLNYMNTFLFRQASTARIYVIEQTKGKFNRAKLFNVGIKESLNDFKYECFIFHDVDLIPEVENNSYTCEKRPVHMSAAVNTMSYKLPYESLFGGVVSISREHVNLANGFSNSYWGWGGEDDDMWERLKAVGVVPTRRAMSISRYTMLYKTGPHTAAAKNPARFAILKEAVKRQKTDGLSNLQYTVVKKEVFDTHTLIVVDLQPGAGHL